MNTKAHRSDTHTAPERAAKKAGRLAAWLAALSPLGYVALVVLMASSFASTIGATTFDELTRTQMDALGGAWIAARVLVTLATVIVILGATLLAWTLRQSSARGVAWTAFVLGILNTLAQVVSGAEGIVAMGFTTATLGEDPTWQRNAALLPLTFGAVVLQLLLLCIALWLSGEHRTTGLVVGVLSLVILVVTAFAAEYVPPFVVALLACPLGIVWLVGERRLGASLS